MVKIAPSKCYKNFKPNFYNWLAKKEGEHLIVAFLIRDLVIYGKRVGVESAGWTKALVSRRRTKKLQTGLYQPFEVSNV